MAGPLELPRPELFSRLSTLPDAFVLRDENRIFCGAYAEETSGLVDPEPDRRPGASGGDFPRWVGVLPYEAFRSQERRWPFDPRSLPLITEPLWARYGAVLELTSAGSILHGSSSAGARLLRGVARARRAPGKPELRLEVRESEGLHRTRIERALEEIGRGNLYQVNLARRFEYSVSGHPVELLEALGSTETAPFAAAFALPGALLVSGSPELCLHHRRDGVVVTRPIKGTRPRGRSAGEDDALVVELERSEKERAELAMVVDIERNDFGRIAEPGSVELVEAPHVVSHPTVHHREATVAARLRPDVDREQLLAAVLPSGSVTGAPKRSAMDLIAELEPVRRGLYTGALGYLAQDGSLRLSMAIRVLSVQGEVGHYHSGGGIVADSDPSQELAETGWKAAFLGPLLGGEPDP